MPITQDRMIALIHAARDFEQAADRTRRIILQECTLAKRPLGNLTPEQRYKAALDNIELMANPKDLMNELLRSHRTIDQEEFHFRKMGSRNASEQRRQANRRNGIPANSPTPQPPEPSDGLTPEAKAAIDREIAAMDLADKKRAAALAKFHGPNATAESEEEARVKREFQGEDDTLDGTLEF